MKPRRQDKLARGDNASAKRKRGKPHGQPVACYLPLAGYDGDTAAAVGYYFSTAEYHSSSAYYWDLSSGSASIRNGYKSYGCSVRCVRSVAQGEVAQAPRASHAWVRASTGEEDGWSWSNLRRVRRRP